MYNSLVLMQVNRKKILNPKLLYDKGEKLN